MDKRYIHISPKEANKPIFRVMPIHRLLEIFNSGYLTLVHPKKWDDPFENLLLRGYIPEVVKRNPMLKIFKHDVFAQCWTFNSETDAMWRIYSPTKQGVKVKTTIPKLINSLSDETKPIWKDGCYIGKVKYLSDTKIVSKLTAIDSASKKDAAISLLYKRKEFKHEKEVRAIFTMGGGQSQSFRIDPQELFDEIIFDPRMDENIYKAFALYLKEAGYTKKIDKSTMYQLPIDLKECI